MTGSKDGVNGQRREQSDRRPSARAMSVFKACYESGVLTRTTGETIAIAPPLIIEETELDRIFDTLAEALKAAA